MVMMEIDDPQSLKYVLTGFLKIKFSDPWFYVPIGNSPLDYLPEV